jgi:tRNA (mo5U34)-methyltransferase
MAKYTPQQIAEKVATYNAWYHRMEVAPGVLTPGLNDSYSVLKYLQLPEDCTGMRVLDIGARDGFFSFVLEQRGAAEVLAFDYAPIEHTGFPILADIFDSRVRFEQANVYDLTAERYGQFDIVLCLGLLYHLRNPLLALDAIRRVCRNELYVESHVIEERFLRKDGAVDRLANISPALLDVPIMRFYPRDEMCNDFSNWWGFNALCLRRLVESANFTVEREAMNGDRAILKCRVAEDKELSLWAARERGLQNQESLRKG